MSMSSRLYERAQRVKHALHERLATWRAVEKRKRPALNGPPPVELLEPRLLMTGAASGQVYADLNANGVLDEREPGIERLVVFLDANQDGLRDSSESFVWTDAQGRFKLTGVDAGDVRVELDQHQGTKSTTPWSTLDARVDAGQMDDLNIGVHRDQVSRPGDPGVHVFGRTVRKEADTGEKAGASGTNAVLLGDPGQAWARWSFDALTTGRYELLARWEASPDLATDAPLTIYDGHERIDHFRVDQTVAPSDRSDALGDWRSLGVFDVIHGAFTVEANQITAFGKPIAVDAMRLIQVGARTAEPVDPTSDSRATTTGDTSANANAEDVQRLMLGGVDRARWDFDELSSGTYAIYVGWDAKDELATDAPLVIYDGGRRIDSLRIDQSVTANDLVEGDSNWLKLGEYNLSGGRLTGEAHAATARGKPVEIKDLRIVQLSDSNDAPTAADGDVTLVGESDGGFATTWPTDGTTYSAMSSNAPPALIFSGEADVDLGETYTLDLSHTDPEGDDLLKWLIDWGDGGGIEEIDATTVSNPAAITHNYGSAGVYTITVQGEDATGVFDAHVDGLPGQLGDSFDSDGKVQHSHLNDIRALDLAEQSDGRIVAAVEDDDGDFVLMRFNADGSLDTTFGTNGRMAMEIGASAGARAVAVQDDDKIVAAGFGYGSGYGGDRDIAVVRLNADGAADSTFGPEGDGVWLKDIDGWEYANDVAIKSDGGIVVASYGGNGDLVVVQLDTTGHLDAEFAGDGIQFIEFDAYGAEAEALAVEDDDQVVVVGSAYSTTNSTSDFAVARLNTDGTLDTSFGADSDGAAMIGFTYGGGSGSAHDYARDVAIQDDGKIVIVGITYGYDYDFALTRLDADGLLDTSFGNNGQTTTDVVDASGYGGQSDYAEGVAIQSDGEIVVGGYSYNSAGGSDDFVLARYDSDGELDASFDDDGYLFTDISGSGSNDEAHAVLIQHDNRIVLAGETYNAGSDEVALARYHAGLLSLDVTVNDPNAPAMSVTGATSVDEGATYTLDLSATNFAAEPDWTVTWGDGAQTQVTGWTAELTHAYADGPNGFVIDVSATDGVDTVDASPMIVGVQNVAPDLTVFGSSIARINHAYELDLSASDPGDDTIIEWTIDWGDGSAPETIAGNPASHGHEFDSFGEYTITATATDEDGTFSADDWTIDVVALPDLSFSGATEIDKDATYTLTLTYDDPGGGGVETWLIDWGDGSSVEEVDATGETTQATYAYETGPAEFTITVQGRDGTGTFDAYIDAPGGELDVSFDADGKLQYTIGNHLRARDAAVQSDGKIVVAVDEGNGQFVIMRFNADGSIDSTFGSGGRKQINEFGSAAGANAVAVQGDDKIVVVGYSYGGSEQDTAIVRLNADGTNDTGFGDTNGSLLVDAGGWDSGEDVAIVSGSGGALAQGSIAIAAYGGAGELVAVLLDDTGDLVDTFGNSGIASAAVGSYSANTTALAIHDEGVVVVGDVYNSGSGSNDFAVVRFDETGSVDGDFNGGAAKTVDFAYGGGGSAYNYARDVAVDDQGRIVIVGNTYDESNDLGVARLLSDGSLDVTFGPDNDGRVATDLIADNGFDGYSDYAESVAIATDGKIVVGGYSYNPNNSSDDFIVARYDTDGDLDVTFDQDGYTYANIDDGYGGSLDAGSALVIQPDGRILLAGKTNGSNGHDDLAMVRYTYGSTELHVTVNSASSGTFEVGGPRVFVAGHDYELNLTALDANGDVTWTIDWGDEQQSNATGHSAAPTHLFDDAGFYTITVSAEDDDGGMGQQTMRVQAVNVAAAAFNRTYETRTYDLKLTAAPTVVINQWDIDWGDGNTDTLIADPQDPWTNPFTVSHTYNDGHALYPIRVIATDDQSQQHVAAVAMSDDPQIFNPGGDVYAPVSATHPDRHAVTMLNDDVFVATTDSNTGTGLDFHLSIFDATGDPNFNNPSLITTDFGASETARAVLVDDSQASDRIVIVGVTTDGLNTDVAVARYETDGQLDTTFDTDGRATLDFGGNEVIVDAVMSGGDLLLAGSLDGDLFLARVDTTGQADVTFGNLATLNGSSVLDVGADAVATDVAIDSLGRIIVLGQLDAAAGTETLIARFDSSGVEDTTFNDGQTYATFGFELGTLGEQAAALQLVADDEFLLSGYSLEPFAIDDNVTFVAKLTADAQGVALDGSFGDGGLSVLNAGDAGEQVHTLLLDASGNIFVTGHAWQDRAHAPYIASFQADGSANPSIALFRPSAIRRRR